MDKIAANEQIKRRKSVIIVMPAYNVAKTLEMTYRAIPSGIIDHIILVDDGSQDGTLDIAQSLGIAVFQHKRNYGYGACQKTCYTEALKTDNDIVVMLHSDYQYDPSLLPNLIQPIVEGKCDIVLGSRFLGSNPMKQGMPWWKYVANKILTCLENIVFRLGLSEYHTGYRAYSREVLENINFQFNSDGFVFDQEIIAQFVANAYTIHEVPVPAKYFFGASSMSFYQSAVYGFSILGLLLRYYLHKSHIFQSVQFESLARRYRKVKNPR